MRSKNLKLMAILATLSLATSTMAQEAASQNTSGATINHWAESIYNEYSAATGGAVTFQVATLKKDVLVRLAGKTLSDILVPPPHRIMAHQVGTELRDPQFWLPDDPAYGRQELSERVNKFAEIGLPLGDGYYRRLNVTATIDGDVRQHEALEFCFAAENHCALLDPVVVFLQSKVENRQRLAAAGWAMRTSHKGISDALDDASAAIGDVVCINPNGSVRANCGGGGTCGLASHPTWTSETYTWPPYTVTYSNIFGFTLVQLSLAQQVAGMSCTTSCAPAPFATSSASSSFGNIGYTTACTNSGATGTTGSAGGAIAQTECTYQLAFTATASVSVKNAGSASVGLNFTMNPSGGVSSNGGSVYDSCGYF